jgi:hypothetical protein
VRAHAEGFNRDEEDLYAMLEAKVKKDEDASRSTLDADAARTLEGKQVLCLLVLKQIWRVCSSVQQRCR